MIENDISRALDDLEELEERIRENYPDAPITRISAALVLIDIAQYALKQALKQ